MEKRKNNIQVIIPTLNEECCIRTLLVRLKDFTAVTVVDGGSVDETCSLVKQYAVRLIQHNESGRAIQMNKGAENTTSDYLLFLHADTSLPFSFKESLDAFIEEKNPQAASFYLSFDSSHWFLKLNALFSRFNRLPFQFGDQGLLIQRNLFEQLKGFDKSLLFMEGNDIVRRSKKIVSFYKIPITLTVSTRKYKEKGVYRLQFSYYIIYLLANIGVPQTKIKRWFKRLL